MDISGYISEHKFQMALWRFGTEIASSKNELLKKKFFPCYIKPGDLILLGSLFLVFMRIEDEGKISRPKDCQRHNPTLHESTAITSNKLFLPNISATLSSFDKSCQCPCMDKDSDFNLGSMKIIFGNRRNFWWTPLLIKKDFEQAPNSKNKLGGLPKVSVSALTCSTR